MDDTSKAMFAGMLALVFLAFSPVREPGGIEVAIGGAALGGALALFFLVRGRA